MAWLGGGGGESEGCGGVAAWMFLFVLTHHFFLHFFFMPGLRSRPLQTQNPQTVKQTAHCMSLYVISSGSF